MLFLNPSPLFLIIYKSIWEYFKYHVTKIAGNLLELMQNISLLYKIYDVYM